MSRCTICRISDLSEIISILERNSSVVTEPSESILIGSQAALKFFRDFRDENTSSPDHDIICSSVRMIKWLQKRNTSINTIEMIIPTCNEEQLDLYVTCTLKNEVKYDFVIPRLSTSYTVYLLNNVQTWTYSNGSSYYSKDDSTRYASEKLLLILKKYMLYYSHQWQKSAKDYRRLLTATDPLTDEDKVLYNLFIQYNEKLHGQRHPDADQFVMKSYKSKETIVIKRDEFLLQKRDEQIACAYQAAKELSIGRDILIGLEHICTKSPPWLVDFVIDNWIDVQNEKFKDNIRLRPSLSIQCEINDYRLFEELPELVTQKILQNITDPLDFDSMKLVCKRWYTIFNQESFWRDLYTSRCGRSSEDTVSWKLAYKMQLIYSHIIDKTHFNQLVDATLHLRRTTSNDILQLWEGLTNQSQSLNSDILSEVDHILSHSYYYDLSAKSGYYSAKLILIGFDHPRSQSKISVNLRAGESGTSSCSYYEETMAVKFDENSQKRRCFSFSGSTAFGYTMGSRRYHSASRKDLTEGSNDVCPRFPADLVDCLFIMIIHPVHRTQFISYLKNLEHYHHKFRHFR